MTQTGIDKVEKLLRLSTSSNAHEAALAAAKAQELIDRYDLAPVLRERQRVSMLKDLDVVLTGLREMCRVARGRVPSRKGAADDLSEAIEQFKRMRQAVRAQSRRDQAGRARREGRNGA